MMTLALYSLVSSSSGQTYLNCSRYPPVHQQRAASPRITGPRDEDKKHGEWRGKGQPEDKGKIYKKMIFMVPNV